MADINLRELRPVRKALGKSQSELAALVGVSTRAIQSYEQGWRPTPPLVLKMAMLLLFLSRRGPEGTVPPCWELRECATRLRAACPAYQLKEGRLCWLVTGTLCEGRERSSWEDKMARCEACSVLRRHLDVGEPVER